VNEPLTEALARLRKEIAEQEKAIARGTFNDIAALREEQGYLRGLERAINIGNSVLNEDDIDN